MIMPLVWLWHHLVWHWDKWSYSSPNKFITAWGRSHHFAEMSHRPAAIMSLKWANLWLVGGMTCLSTMNFSSDLMPLKAKLLYFMEEKSRYFEECSGYCFLYNMNEWGLVLSIFKCIPNNRKSIKKNVSYASRSSEVLLTEVPSTKTQ